MNFFELYFFFRLGSIWIKNKSDTFRCSAFTDARPTEAEREVWEQVDVVLKDAKGILDELQAYKGAGQEIREVQLIQ